MDRLVAPLRAEVECYVLDRSVGKKNIKFNIHIGRNALINCICNKNLSIDAWLHDAFYFVMSWTTKCCAREHRRRFLQYGQVGVRELILEGVMERELVME
jgi:hypothetical protein